jgi:DNA helicase-2/ATP-dependent DNA helicase PcrA
MTRMLRGEVQYNPVSRFVEEIPKELLDQDIDEPFGGAYSSGGGYSFGGGYGSRGYGSGSGPAGTAAKGARLRPKAVYKKPATDPAKKPYIAKASAGGRSLSSLSKGMPSTAGSPDYQAGDRVRHTKYGVGTVKAVEKGPRDYKVTVIFDEYGQKIMYAAFAKLVKC